MNTLDTLSTQHLTLAYDQARIVENLNLTLYTGEITVLVGANGCGKSTLLRGLSRLLKPQGGQVILNGQDIWKMPARALAQQLGILPQSPTAPEGLTVHELVSQGRYPHQGWLRQWSNEDARIVEAAMDVTGVAEFADRPIDTLSGGQRQRAWIAMTLAQDSDIILLDEPTTFLDLAYQIEVLDLLYHLNREQEKTIIMVLHDLNHACRYADTLVAVKQGQIAVQGDPAEVVTEAMVQDVFGLSAQVMRDPVTGTPLVIPVGQGGKRKRSPAISQETAVERARTPIAPIYAPATAFAQPRFVPQEVASVSI